MPYRDRQTADLRRTWYAMINRCHNPRSSEFEGYGSRGITVCARWRESFVAFVVDVGLRPDGMEIDRINNDGNYEPGNCRWATRSENQKNKRVTDAVLAAAKNAREARARKGSRITPCHGEKNPRAKLTEADVVVMRDEFDRGVTTLGSLAARYNVHTETIRGIVRREKWKHVS